MVQQENKSSTFIKDCILGGTAGSISKTVSAPLERVKLLLQTQDSNFQLKDKKYTGFFNCFVRIYREEGVLAYWKGNWANILRYFPTTAFNFGFKDFFNRTFNKYDPVKNPNLFMLGNIMAGGSAGACCMFLVYPLDFSRTRMGVDVGKDGEKLFKSLTHCMTSIYQKNGIRGLYQGLGISLLSIFSYRGMYFGFFDTGKKRIKNYDEKPFWFKFGFAQILTMGSETVNYPFDTIRRRLMMNSGLEKKLYNNSIECIRIIHKEEGLTGFFKGNLSNMVRSISSSLVLVLYDEFQRKLQKKK
jgi:solute carrier family 25 (adenine nucleotide translocator) protein 4/5/6/31